MDHGSVMHQCACTVSHRMSNVPNHLVSHFCVPVCKSVATQISIEIVRNPLPRCVQMDAGGAAERIGGCMRASRWRQSAAAALKDGRNKSGAQLLDHVVLRQWALRGFQNLLQAL